MSKNTSRSLGEGKITKSDEHVIFTANKQTNQNECKYQAVSVVLPRELQPVIGRIAEIVPNRFCYAECRKIGKVFVPFSARIERTTKHWLGKGAEPNREVHLKIFPQPQINGCNFVAYSISFLNGDAAPTEGIKVNSVDVIYEQIGIIVECPPAGDVKVFSHMSGFARLPASYRKNWMSKGRHIRYDAIKQQIPSQEKVHWAIRKCYDLGLLFHRIDENPMKPEQLTIEVYAVINRVASNPPSKCAWFWNDFIGRIYCYPQNYVAGMNVMECVKCKVLYTGAFDDVPWSAYDIELLGEDEDVRNACAQMLVTRDDWTVTYTDRQKISLIGFLESPSMQPGQCFLAWTDLADSDAPPAVGQKCRATVYYQVRKDKHQWRAVLITPLNPNGVPTSSHPNHSGQRILSWPDPLEAPVVDSVSSTVASSPGISTMAPPGFNPLDNIPPPIGAGMKSYNQMVKMNGVVKHEGLPSNGHGYPLPIGSAANAFALEGLGNPMNDMPPLPPLEGLTFNHLSDSQRGSPMEKNGAGSSANSESGFLHMFTNGGWNRGPNSDIFQAFQPNGLQPAGSFVGSPSDIEMKDTGTQTDTIVEQEVLRDVLKNTDCLKTILQNFPGHTERIISMSANWR